MMLTCYDYPTAQREEAAGADIIFIGDSVGTNVLGYDSVKQVTMDDMLHHLRAVRRGVKEAFILVDMPFKSYDTPELAVENARRFTACGADGVKLEGGREVIDTVHALRSEGVEVCGHVGFTPQTGGARGTVVGKTTAEAEALIQDTAALDHADVFMIVLELVPEELSQMIAKSLSCCIIGIGSGRNLDGEVQVVNDILGITGRTFRHTKRFEVLGERTESALNEFISMVRQRRFPEECNVTHIPPEVFDNICTLREDHTGGGQPR